MSAPGPTGERQEYLNAITSFPGAEQKRKLFRILDILTANWATGDIPEICRLLLNTLKKENDPTAQMFDADEWIRSLTEAQEITADIPEERITHNQSEVDPEKVRPIPDGSVSAKICFQAL